MKKEEQNAKFLVSESLSDKYIYKNAYGDEQIVTNSGLFLMTEDGNFLGNISPESIPFVKKGEFVYYSDIRWRSRRSGFIAMDFNNPRVKDIHRFWIDIKNPITKRFQL